MLPASKVFHSWPQMQNHLFSLQNLVPLSWCNQVKGGLAQIDAEGCDVHVMILLM